MNTTVLIVIVVLLVLFVIFVFNNLVIWRNRVRRAFSDLDAAYQKRFDTVPNLVESVKAYMKHEKNVLEDVTKARAAVSKAGSAEEKAGAENQLSGALKTLFAVAENYPDLKADQNVSQLMSELVDLEDKILAARRFYNSSVMEYNTRLETFPNNIFAGLFGFSPENPFEVENGEARKAVSVDFEDKEKK